MVQAEGGVQVHVATVVAANSPTVADWVMAGGAAVTAVAAIVALIYGFNQVQEMRRARELTAKLELARTQPYVVMTVEEDTSVGLSFELVVENFGVTAAYGLEFHFAETLKRSTKGATGAMPIDTVMLPAVIPVLAPGQQWRTYWDHASGRTAESLPDRYEGKLTYRGVDGSALESPVVLDLEPIRARIYSEELGIHEAAEALKKIADLLKTWTDPFRRAVRVQSRDGDEFDRQQQRELNRRRGIPDRDRPRGGLRGSRNPTDRRRGRRGGH